MLYLGNFFCWTKNSNVLYFQNTNSLSFKRRFEKAINIVWNKILTFYKQGGRSDSFAQFIHSPTRVRSRVLRIGILEVQGHVTKVVHGADPVRSLDWDAISQPCDLEKKRKKYECISRRVNFEDKKSRKINLKMNGKKIWLVDRRGPEMR